MMYMTNTNFTMKMLNHNVAMVIKDTYNITVKVILNLQVHSKKKKRLGGVCACMCSEFLCVRMKLKCTCV